MGFFDKLKKIVSKDTFEDKKEKDLYDKGFEKTRKEFTDKLNKLNKKYSKVNSEYFEELEEILIMADIGVNTVMSFMDRLVTRAKNEKITDPKELKELIVDELFIIYVNDEILVDKIKYNDNGPTVILFVGVNGVGKTTTIAKLAKREKDKGKKVMMVAGDTFRAGAVEQLETWGEKIGVKVVSSTLNADPSSVMYKGLEEAKEDNYDVVLIDTAGRLHVDEELMNELKALNEEFNPDEILLVLDSMIGQDAINVINGFNDKLPLTGTILTKLDGDTKGGVALSARHLTNVPIKFIGTSEKLDGLEVFDPERMVNRILGMGDIMSLVEKVESVYTEEDEKNAEKTFKKMQKGKFDLEDFLAQFKQIKKLGSIEGLLKLIPGAKKMGLNNINIDPKDMARVEAIILSMTPEERRKPEIIKANRKIRIAKGSGTSVQEVNKLLTQFEQSKKMMKMFSNGSFKMPF